MSWILKNNGKILEDICLDPQTVEEEVLINGAIILDSYLKSVTLIRGLGMNTDRLHRPVNVVANEIVANIHDQFEQYANQAADRPDCVHQFCSGVKIPGD